MISYKSIELQRIGNQSKGKAKYVINGNEYFAEEAAIRHYEMLGYKALWTENTYWWTLMSLFFWDIIFAKIRGSVIVVIGGVQTELSPEDENFEPIFNQTVRELNGMPHDFFTPEFYERRKHLIKNKIEELYRSNLEKKLRDSYKQNYGKNCRSIEDWDKYKIDQLLTLIPRINKEKLIGIVERLISNFTDNRSGLPDLIVYDDKSFFFSEVKSAKDKISEKQREWHDFLSKTLGFKVEIFLINHTHSQIKKIEALYAPRTKEITVSFGHSSSKKREEAIRFMQEQESYFLAGKGKGRIYGAKFAITEDDIEKLYTILDLTSGWKTQKIEIDGEIIKSTKLRNSLWCLREKVKQGSSLDYCKRRQYDNKPNKFGCRNFYFHELENEEWQDYGYVDTVKGEWIFDHEKISEKIEEEISRVKYCPLFDVKKTRRLAKKIPQKIDPKIDKDWGFISNDYKAWFWHENRWLNTFGATDFPGFSVMTGIKKLAAKERNEAIQWSKRDKSIEISFKEKQMTHPPYISDYVFDDDKMMSLIKNFGELVEKGIIKEKFFEKTRDAILKLRRKASKTMRKKRRKQKAIDIFVSKVNIMRELVNAADNKEIVGKKHIKRLVKDLK